MVADDQVMVGTVTVDNHILAVNGHSKPKDHADKPDHISSKWLIGVLETKFNRKVSNWSAVALGEGTGFLSHVSKISVEWEPIKSCKTISSSTEEPPHSLILKIPTVEKITPPPGKEPEPHHNDGGIDFADFIWRGHKVECAVYDYFQKTDAQKLFPIPKLFGCEPSGDNAYLLFSDLSDHSKTPALVDGLSVEQCKNMVRVLAAIQVHCLVNQEKWSQLTHSIKDVVTFSESLVLKMGPMVQQTSSGVRQAFPDAMTLSAEEMTRVTDLPGYYAHAMGEEGHKVHVHGDAWLNIFLLQNSAATGTLQLSDTVAALIDWQCVFEGCWSRDLCFLLVSSLNTELRKAHEREILAEFYECFKSTLKAECHQKNLSYEKILAPFTFEHLLRRYNAGLVHCAIQFMIQNSFWAINPATEKKYGKDCVERVVRRYVNVLKEQLSKEETTQSMGNLKM